jgi:transcriptional regulator with XRE-family HTH domain
MIFVKSIKISELQIFYLYQQINGWIKMLHFVFMQNNLKKLRKAAGLTQEKLADMLDVAQGIVSAWENGKMIPSVKRVPQLAKILDCSEAEIWGYELSGRPIPILSWVSAGHMVSCDAFNGSSQQENMGTLLFEGRPNGKFALQVQGNSMNRMAPEGSLIVVDGINRDLIDGKPYIFCNVSNAETTFKLYKKDPTRLEPFSTEDGYETIKITSPRNNDEWQVIGRVIEVRTSLV